jgi:hypothetical protein
MLSRFGSAPTPRVCTWAPSVSTGNVAGTGRRHPGSLGPPARTSHTRHPGASPTVSIRSSVEGLNGTEECIETLARLGLPIVEQVARSGHTTILRSLRLGTDRDRRCCGPVTCRPGAGTLPFRHSVGRPSRPLRNRGMANRTCLLCLGSPHTFVARLRLPQN